MNGEANKKQEREEAELQSTRARDREVERGREKEDAKRLNAFLSFTPLLIPTLTLLILTLLSSSPPLFTSLLLPLFLFLYEPMKRGLSLRRTIYVSSGIKMKKKTKKQWENFESSADSQQS